MAEVVREKIANNILEGKDNAVCSAPKSLHRDTVEYVSARQSSSSSYLLAEDQSALSREIDHWMNGGHSTTATPVPSPDPGYQHHQQRPTLVQRSVIARSSSLDSQGLWCLLAMILPLFSVQTCPHWRCTPSLVLNTAELLMNNLSRLIAQARRHIHRFSQDQVAREVFATLMDVVLVIYAIGFLVLSLYQASIFN